MHFENRNDYVMWATVHLLGSMNLQTDSNALSNAVKLAQDAANYFYGPANKTATTAKNPFTDPPEIRKPPQVTTAGPAVPGQKVEVPVDVPQQQS